MCHPELLVLFPGEMTYVNQFTGPALVWRGTSAWSWACQETSSPSASLLSMATFPFPCWKGLWKIEMRTEMCFSLGMCLPTWEEPAGGVMIGMEPQQKPNLRHWDCWCRSLSVCQCCVQHPGLAAHWTKAVERKQMLPVLNQAIYSLGIVVGNGRKNTALRMGLAKDFTLTWGDDYISFWSTSQPRKENVCPTSSLQEQGR